jgi:TPR repeat protein
MKRLMAVCSVAAAMHLMHASAAFAGPWEDGMAAYNRADYVPALQLFRPLAEQGNPKAFNVIGVMYRKGQGVLRDRVRALMWLTLAAAEGERDAKAAVREMSRTMQPDEISRARDMAQTCEVSDYHQCEF